MSVAVVGSINVDILLSVATLPRGGETVLASASARMPGGKGANQAVAAARMGTQVAMTGAVGDDADGAWMRETLAQAGVDVTGVVVLAGQATGAAYIAIDAAAENLIIVAPGANTGLTPDLVSGLGEVRVVLAQLEVPVAMIAAAFADDGRVRILNAAPAVAAASVLFDATDVLIVNEHELADYLGERMQGNGPVSISAARTLLTRPDQVVIVTLGAQGAVAVWHDRHVHAPAMPVTPVDTVGAGDCFCGTLAALLDEGMTVDDALPIANAAAALCTQASGAIPAMPMRAAVMAMLARSPTEHAQAIKNARGAALS